MQMDLLNDLESVTKAQERKNSYNQNVPYTDGSSTISKIDETKNTNIAEDKRASFRGKEKEPAESSMKDAISKLNAQISNTHCAYSYDEDTKRISIKVYDDETNELIREVPPEKSLEALKKMWEIAGIIMDEKR